MLSEPVQLLADGQALHGQLNRPTQGLEGAHEVLAIARAGQDQHALAGLPLL